MTPGTHPAPPAGSADPSEPNEIRQPAPRSPGRPDGDGATAAASGAGEHPDPPEPRWAAEPSGRPRRHSAGSPLGTVPARTGIVLGLLLWVLAGYWAFAPLEVPTSQGPPFRCGTALSQPTDTFGRNVCGGLNDRAALKAGTFLLAGVIVVAGGFFVGAPTRRDGAGTVSEAWTRA